MLLYKAWLETRGRFLAAALVLALLGLATVLRAQATISSWEAFHNGEHMEYALYVWLSLSHGYLQFLWIICAVILGLGGLLREHSLGTSGFTLSLPVRRWVLVVTRASVGAAEAIVLGLISGVLVAVLSPIVGHRFPIGQAFLFGFVLAGGGLAFYALGLFLSHVIRGEYAAPGLGLGIIAAFYLLTRVPAFDGLDVFELMSGAEFMSSKTFLLTSFPGREVAGWLAGAIAFGLLSVLAAARKEF